jgi:hypothetical protein
MAGGTHGCDLGFSRIKVGGLHDRRYDQQYGQSEYFFHGPPLWQMISATSC